MYFCQIIPRKVTPVYEVGGLDCLNVTCNFRGYAHHNLTGIYTDDTVDPLSNDHPLQRPSLLYDHILCDGQCFLFVPSLTDDHPSDATNDRVRWDFLPRERPSRLQCISKNRGWRFNIRSQWWIITMLCLDTFQVIQLL